LYIVLAPLYLKSVRKLQEKRFVFVKILAIIIPENGAKVSKIKCFQFAQQTLITESNFIFLFSGKRCPILFKFNVLFKSLSISASSEYISPDLLLYFISFSVFLLCGLTVINAFPLCVE